MSKFSTIIPVDIASILALLPKGAYIHSKTFNPEKSEVTIEWESERFHSGLSVAVDFPTEDLAKKRLPRGVRDKNRKESPPKVPDAPTVKEEAAAPVIQDNLIRTKEGYDKAVSEGKVLEFQGLEPQWRPVDPKEHVFTEGYYYREVKKELAPTASSGVEPKLT